MIHGIGTDLVKVERIAMIYARHGERLVQRILMTAEIEACGADRRAARFLAMRFAAKEAVAKVMGTGFSLGMRLTDVGVAKSAHGQPQLIWSERGRRLCEQLGIGESHLTLSDDHGLAMAVVVLMRR